MKETLRKLTCVTKCGLSSSPEFCDGYYKTVLASVPFFNLFPTIKCATVKPVLSDHSKIDKANILMTNGSLMQVKRIAECSPWSILQYFLPAFSDNWS